MKKQDQHFINNYEFVDSKDKPEGGPWAEKPPLKPRPKQFDANDPERIGG